MYIYISPSYCVFPQSGNNTITYSENQVIKEQFSYFLFLYVKI